MHIGFPLDHLQNFRCMAGGIDNILRRNRQRIDMEPRHFDRRPVNHQTRDPSFANHHIFHAHTIKNGCSRASRLRTNGRNGQNGVGGVITFLIGPVANSECVQDFPGVILDDDFVEHHSTAPHPSAQTQFTLKKSNLFTRGREIISGNQSGRTSTDNGNIHVRCLKHFLRKSLNDRS